MNRRLPLEIRKLFTIDLVGDPPAPPPNPEDFWIVVYASLGATGDPGSDDFIFYVTTPVHLGRTIGMESWQLGRHLIIVNRFNWGTIRAAIQSICDSVEAETWDVAAEQLARHGAWELEDYQESPNQ